MTLWSNTDDSGRISFPFFSSSFISSFIYQATTRFAAHTEIITIVIVIDVYIQPEDYVPLFNLFYLVS